ncbi:MAG: hypothetical protein ACP6IY_20920 [Promethearchaeia archaeon]
MRKINPFDENNMSVPLSINHNSKSLGAFKDDHGITWTQIKIPIYSELKEGDHAFTWAFIALFTYIFTFWIIYITQWIPIWNIFAFFATNVSLIFIISIKIEDIYKNKVDWELKVDIFQYVSLWVIVFLYLDLMFDVYIIPNLFGMKDIYSAITINTAITLLIIAINSIVLLSVAPKRLNTKIVVKYTYPILILISSLALFIVLIISYITIRSKLIELEAFLPELYLGAGDMVYQGFLHLYLAGLPEGQYGGAEMFTAVFEMLFYSRITGFMLAIMVIGTFANIFVINQTRSSALQSATTLTVIGIPMIMIISMFLGVIPPPVSFVKIFGAEAIASFVFTFAMLSVYIIFLSLMMVFSHAAEVFQPQEED